MNFRDFVCAHLSGYKVDVLGVTEDGIFRYKGRDIPKSHILPAGNSDRNILERYRQSFFESEYSKIKFHQFFHHLNSSQALCINFFYPLIVENKLVLFLKFLGLDSATDLTSEFEKDSDLEMAKRRTSFDFYARLDGARNIFVEVKYTESGFAAAKKDDEHRKKFRETYLPILLEKSTYLVPECRDESVFLDHYQVLRNLVHVNETDFVVLFFPAANARVAEEAAYARDHLLTDKGKERLRIVFLDQIVSYLETECAGSVLDGYYQEFRTKYLPPR
jgi:hypothetical protein